MATKYTTRVSVTLTSLLLISLVGCQKNSYQSCIDIQTETATRQYKNLTSDKRGNVTLQEYIDMLVPVRCAGVK